MTADVSTTPHNSRRDFLREMWLAEKIAKASGVKYCGIFAGATDPALRAARARELILTHKLAALRPSQNSTANFADRYTEIYGQPLTQEPHTEPHQEDLLCSNSTP